MSKFIESLREDHEVILKALNVLNNVEAIDAIKKIVDFIKNFVDNCHHMKEKSAIPFPRIKGVS
ncbi:hypothetical protein [Sulfurisphaera ohwakuensis]|uniref:hypothetical protein n=1 Tax=Sulfurisphaera ohwakuensis TaxID=69656 RepID=UPI0036F30BB1